MIEYGRSSNAHEKRKDLWEGDEARFTSEGHAALGEAIAGTVWQGIVAP